MEYRSIYRSHRPKTFHELVGQEHLTRALLNALTQGKVSHAYLFTGTRGTGKTTAARILAKAVNCLNPINGEPCNECSLCKGIDQGSVMDVIEIDAASNRGIDEIRDLRENTRYLPSEGKKKIYIIDEVHMLTNEAFNALLKTLEEPPEHIMFILATTEPNKLPATILSRCQRFDLKRIKSEDMAKRLMEILVSYDVKIDEDALRLVVYHAKGSLRDAETFLDQCMVMGGDHITKPDVLQMLGDSDDGTLLRFAKEVKAGNYPELLKITENALGGGASVPQFLSELMTLFRNMMLYKVSADESVLLFLSEENQEEFRSITKALSYDHLFYLLEVLSEADRDIKWAGDQKTMLEIAMLKLVRSERERSMEALLLRVETLEKELEELKKNGVSVSPPPPEPEKKIKQSEEKAAKIPPKIKEPIPVANEIKQTPDLAKNWLNVLSEVKKTHRAMSLRIYKEGIVPVEKVNNTILFEAKGDVERVKRILADKDCRAVVGKAFRTVLGFEEQDFIFSLRPPALLQKSVEEEQRECARKLFPNAEIELI